MDATRAMLGQLVRADYSRRVMIMDDINSTMSEDVVGKLQELDTASASRIVIGFNSNGGQNEGAFLIIENILALRAPTIGIVYGRCFSAAFNILQACSERYAMPSARLVLHNNYKGLKVTPDLEHDAVAEYVKEMLTEQKELREKIVKFLRRRLTHFSREEIVSMMDKGRILDPTEAISLGMLDGIIRGIE